MARAPHVQRGIDPPGATRTLALDEEDGSAFIFFQLRKSVVLAVRATGRTANAKDGAGWASQALKKEEEERLAAVARSREEAQRQKAHMRQMREQHQVGPRPLASRPE